MSINGHLNLNAIIKNNKAKSKSKNKTNNNINNISKNNNNHNLILSNINISPIRHEKKLYFTPHSYNETDNKKNFQPLKKAKVKIIINPKQKIIRITKIVTLLKA